MRRWAQPAIIALGVVVGGCIIAFLLMFPPRAARVERPFGPAAEAALRLESAVDVFRETDVKAGPPREDWPWQREVNDSEYCFRRVELFQEFRADEPPKCVPRADRNYGMGERFDAGAGADAEDQPYESRRAVWLSGAHDRLGFIDGSAASEILRFGVGNPSASPAFVTVSGECSEGESWPRILETKVIEAPKGWSDHQVELRCRERVSVEFQGRDVYIAHPRLWRDASLKPRPNVLLINIDTLLPAALGYMGNPRGATPNLDRFAAESIVWTQAYANGNWSKPSHASFFTSQRPHDLGLKFWRNANDALELRLWHDLRHRTLVHAFRDAGYFTYGAASNLFDSPVLPTGMDLGFERFTDNPTALDHPLELIDDIERFLQTQRNAPFFLFFNPETPHYKYRPPREYLFQTGGVKSLDTLDWDLYLGEVAYADAYLGRILDLIDHHGLRANTIVMVTSDHGEQLDAAHAMAVHLRDPFDPFDYYARKTTRFRHGLSPFDEEWHVPWLVRMPDGAGAGTRLEAQVEVLDQAPTLLALAGLPPEPSFQGRVVYPTAPPDRPALLEGRNFDAIRLPPWKYIRRVPGTELIAPENTTKWRFAPESLYDLANDPRELTDVAAGNPHVLAQFRALHQTLRGPPEVLWHVRTTPGRATRGTVEVPGREPLTLGAEELVFRAPADAVITVTATCAPGDVRVGALNLPLAQSWPLALGPNEARATLALGPPKPAGSLQIWQTPFTDGGPETTDTGVLGKDLESALRAWGYAH